jgi:hypothetical protein
MARHRVICSDCAEFVAEPREAVVEDDCAFVRFLESHSKYGHRLIRRVIRDVPWTVIDGFAGLPAS